MSTVKSPYAWNRNFHAILKALKIALAIFLGAMLAWGLADPNSGERLTDTETWYGYVVMLYFAIAAGTLIRAFRWDSGRVLFLTTGVVYVLSVKFPEFHEKLGELINLISYYL